MDNEKPGSWKISTLKHAKDVFKHFLLNGKRELKLNLQLNSESHSSQEIPFLFLALMLLYKNWKESTNWWNLTKQDAVISENVQTLLC